MKASQEELSGLQELLEVAKRLAEAESGEWREIREEYKPDAMDAAAIPGECLQEPQPSEGRPRQPSATGSSQADCQRNPRGAGAEVFHTSAENSYQNQGAMQGKSNSTRSDDFEFEELMARLNELEEAERRAGDGLDSDEDSEGLAGLSGRLGGLVRGNEKGARAGQVKNAGQETTREDVTRGTRRARVGGARAEGTSGAPAEIGTGVKPGARAEKETRGVAGARAESGTRVTVSARAESGARADHTPEARAEQVTGVTTTRARASSVSGASGFATTEGQKPSQSKPKQVRFADSSSNGQQEKRSEETAADVSGGAKTGSSAAAGKTVKRTVRTTKPVLGKVVERMEQDLDPKLNPTSNPIPNPIPNPNSHLKPNPQQYPNLNLKPSPSSSPNSNPNSNPNSSPDPNPCSMSDPNPNLSPNPNLNPNPNPSMNLVDESQGWDCLGEGSGQRSLPKQTENGRAADNGRTAEMGTEVGTRAEAETGRGAEIGKGAENGKGAADGRREAKNGPAAENGIRAESGTVAEKGFRAETGRGAENGMEDIVAETTVSDEESDRAFFEELAVDEIENSDTDSSFDEWDEGEENDLDEENGPSFEIGRQVSADIQQWLARRQQSVSTHSGGTPSAYPGGTHSAHSDGTPSETSGGVPPSTAYSRDMELEDARMRLQLRAEAVRRLACQNPVKNGLGTGQEAVKDGLRAGQEPAVKAVLVSPEAAADEGVNLSTSRPRVSTTVSLLTDPAVSPSQQPEKPRSHFREQMQGRRAGTSLDPRSG